MTISAIVISILLTVFILGLSLLTISQGYGFKHTVDPSKLDEEQLESREQTEEER